MNRKIYELCLDGFAAFIGNVIHTFLSRYCEKEEKIAMVAFLDMPDGKSYKLTYKEIDPVTSLMAKEEKITRRENKPNVKEEPKKYFSSN